MPLHIAICIATFRRHTISQTLESLARLNLPDDVDVTVIVADNDGVPSARARVEAAARKLPFPITYLHAPSSNISIARNACLQYADTVDRLAFIDDDEVCDPDWLKALLEEMEASGADAVFGPAQAIYPTGTPKWMLKKDIHTNTPVMRNGRVETGHTCNALLRWRGCPWSTHRFDLARGHSGGEDTAFFFEIGRMGARFSATEKAVVFEPVSEDRLCFSWLFRRRFRMGQSYAARSMSTTAKASLALQAAAKTVVCMAASAIAPLNPDSGRFWILRGAFHTGVIAGLLMLPQPHLYGGR